MLEKKRVVHLANKCLLFQKNQMLLRRQAKALRNKKMYACFEFYAITP
jgi:hypothetical protein